MCIRVHFIINGGDYEDLASIVDFTSRKSGRDHHVSVAFASCYFCRRKIGRKIINRLVEPVWRFVTADQKEQGDTRRRNCWSSSVHRALTRSIAVLAIHLSHTITLDESIMSLKMKIIRLYHHFNLQPVAVAFHIIS